MRIKKLEIKNFGPFIQYELNFIKSETCMLLTGRNNEGKSTIINAFKLIDASLRAIQHRRNQIIISGEMFYALNKQDTENIVILRMIHDYEDIVAIISVFFDDDFEVHCYLDPIENHVYARFYGKIPIDINNIFGFIPVLGPISEKEEILTNISYIRTNFRTSLAPRHLRNTLHQIIDTEEYKLIQKIIKNTWDSIELKEIETDYENNNISVFYTENRITREISWAGQGLQIWFQIITHLVRLKDYKLLILDEPEINLHPEKQNDLIVLLSQYFTGSILIATHSVELMNNVSVSHIMNIKKIEKKPKMKSTKNRTYLDTIRSQVGSNFNLIASQFENFDYIIFTEDKYDFTLINRFALKFLIIKNAFNIPIHGFQEYKKIKYFVEAYEMLIGKKVKYVCVLDRDYYPQVYLDSVKADLKKDNVKLVFTPGKEIENFLIKPNVIKQLFSHDQIKGYELFLDDLYKKEYIGAFASCITLAEKFGDNKSIDKKTIIEKIGPKFQVEWESDYENAKKCPGKKFLKEIRQYYKEITKKNLVEEILINKYGDENSNELKAWIESIYGNHKRVN